MSSTNKTALALLQSCLLLATFLAAGAVTTPAIAQERRSQRDGDRGDSDEKSDDAPSIGMNDYAKGLVKKYDKNRNMMLDGDERKSLRPPASLADANNDNVITTEELVARLSGPASKTSSGSSSTSTAAAAEDEKGSEPRERDRGGFFGSRRGNSDSDKSESDSKSATTSKRVLTWTGGEKAGDDDKKARRTYRFTPAGEKLPTGLPSWFKSQDKNGDGQVAMSEYSRTWSKSTVAKFRGYDLNDDGVITAKEAGK